jgi:aminoglycoside 6'-N-acetyltransferase I
MAEITIRQLQQKDEDEWLRMRLALWPYETFEELLTEMAGIFPNPEMPVFVAERADGRLGGFLEGGTRPYAEGCETSPAGYIEGWYVDEDLRRQGVGRMLMDAMEAWARERGLKELGSDTWLWNEASIGAHLRLGYAEAERLVHFAKKL